MGVNLITLSILLFNISSKSSGKVWWLRSDHFVSQICALLQDNIWKIKRFSLLIFFLTYTPFSIFVVRLGYIFNFD